MVSISVSKRRRRNAESAQVGTIVFIVDNHGAHSETWLRPPYSFRKEQKTTGRLPPPNVRTLLFLRRQQARLARVDGLAEFVQSFYSFVDLRVELGETFGLRLPHALHFRP